MTALNNCERVRIEINVEKRMILLVPVTAKDKDNVRWLKAGKEPQARRIDCSAFTTLLYKNWGWDKENVYRASGRVVTSEKKVMLLFEFEDTETWKFGGTAKGKKDAISNCRSTRGEMLIQAHRPHGYIFGLRCNLCF